MAKKTSTYSLVLDVGTTGAKALVFDAKRRILTKAYGTYPVTHPKRSWVEQDPMKILSVCRRVLRAAVRTSGIAPKRIAAFGMTNQRETTILWDAKTLKPIAPAIVWQDGRTARRCTTVSPTEKQLIREKTGLLCDAYFSASKLEWLLSRIPAAQTLTDVGRLRFGTPDTWLLANLCEHAPHLTDETNASRTLLFDIKKRAWDEDLCALFSIPLRILPAVLPPRADFGMLREDLLGRAIPVRAVVGDQQASFYAAAASSHGRRTTKITYGTGTFVTQTLGTVFTLRDGFFTTLVPAPPKSGRGTTYALEAKVGISGPNVSARLKNAKALRAYLTELARDVNRYIQRLPVCPKELIIDGGIARAPELAEIQERISGIRVRPLETHDGTALGTALLLN